MENLLLTLVLIGDLEHGGVLHLRELASRAANIVSKIGLIIEVGRALQSVNTGLHPLASLFTENQLRILDHLVLACIVGEDSLENAHLE